LIASHSRPTVWLLQDGEPLPIDSNPRLMRTGDQARLLLQSGFGVVWWTSRFNHNLKRFRDQAGTWCSLGPDYTIALLDGPGYDANISWRRIRHYRAIAAHFDRISEALEPPSLIVGSYPSPELCDAGRRYAERHGVPFIVDIRDPWPDIFPGYLPQALRWSLFPVLWYYRRHIRAIAKSAVGIVAVSKAMLEWGIHYAGRRPSDADRVFHIGFPRPPENREIRVPSEFTPDEPLTCVFATSCGRSYNGAMLMDAARLLEASGERRLRFIVAGDGEMRADWMSRAQGLRSVHFTGWLSHGELQRHFYAAHIGVILITGGISRFWVGNKIFEYLASSLAIVNDAPGESAEIVDDHGLGTNVARGSAESLARALQALAAAPESVRAQMVNARQAFLQHFDRDNLISKYVDYLSSVAQVRGTRAA
jgi:glycosyltransferase involved in cell wall biosynthesis